MPRFPSSFFDAFLNLLLATQTLISTGRVDCPSCRMVAKTSRR